MSDAAISEAAMADRSEMRGSRCFFWGAAVSIAVALVALTVLRLMPVSPDVFGDPQRRWVLARLPNSEIAAMKIAQAEREPRYDVGLFGNSRILMLGTDELALPGQRMFNFALGGESVRQSIRLLDALRSHGKAPRTAVISMDYVELGMPGGRGVFPGPPRRWLEEMSDIWIAGRREGLRSAAVQAINVVDAEWYQFGLMFNHQFILSKLEALFGADGPPVGFRADGSLKERAADGPVVLNGLTPRADTYPQLEADFAWLAAIRDSGVRVIAYESPVAPQFMTSGGSNLSAKAADVRRRFRAACDRLHLECYAPPILDSRPWFDRDHAPAALLAAWLRPLIERKD